MFSRNMPQNVPRLRIAGKRSALSIFRFILAHLSTCIACNGVLDTCEHEDWKCAALRRGCVCVARTVGAESLGRRRLRGAFFGRVPYLGVLTATRPHGATS